MKRNEITSVVVIAMLASAFAPSLAKKEADSKPRGERIFQQHCASCHAGGGNSVNPKAPLAESKQLASLATIKAYLSAPPGHMPYYQDVVDNPETLKALYNYCKTLKRQPLKQASSEQLQERI